VFVDRKRNASKLDGGIRATVVATEFAALRSISVEGSHLQLFPTSRTQNSPLLLILAVFAVMWFR